MLKYLRRKDVLLGILTVMAAIFIYMPSRTFPVALGNQSVGAATFPHFISYCLGLLGVIITVSGIRDKNPSYISFELITATGFHKVLAGIVVVFLFSLGLKSKLFLISSFICVYVFMLLTGAELDFRKKEFYYSVFYAFAICISVYYVFGNLLKVDL